MNPGPKGKNGKVPLSFALTQDASSNKDQEKLKSHLLLRQAEAILLVFAKEGPFAVRKRMSGSSTVAGQQPNEVDEVIRRVMAIDRVKKYVIFSREGIVLRHDGWPSENGDGGYKKCVQLAGTVSLLLHHCEQGCEDLLAPPNVSLRNPELSFSFKKENLTFVEYRTRWNA